MKVYLSKEDTAFKDAVLEILEHHIWWNPNFNGIKYKMILDHDYTFIDEIDELHGTFLLHNILKNIDILKG
jgi:hypothetical protein